MTGLLHEKEFSRKSFLKGGGALIVGFSLTGAGLAGKAQAAGVDPYASSGPADPNAIDSFIAIHADNTASLTSGRQEIGQGSTTALVMIAAEELDLNMSQMKHVVTDTGGPRPAPNTGNTGGSTSIKQAGPIVRQAAAEARQALLGLASVSLGVPVASLTVADGVVSGGGKSVKYGDLLGDKLFSVKFTGKAPTKPVSSYKLVGTRPPRIDLPAKVIGTHTYIQNVRLPGMLHGRVVRPRGQSAYGESMAKPLSIDESSIKHIPNVQVVRRGDFLGVVAQKEYDAIQAAAQLKVKWADPAIALPGNGNWFGDIRAAKTIDKVVTNRGNVDQGLASAAKVVSGTFTGPYTMHGPIGPNAAVADVTPTGAVVMHHIKDPYGATRPQLAPVLGLPESRIRLIYFEGASSFGGGAIHNDSGQAAAVMSQIVGKPVRVQFMRWDEHGWDNYGGSQVLDVRGGVDANGKIVAFDVTGWITAEGGSNRATTADLAGLGPLDPGGGSRSIDAPNFASGYAIANYRVIGKGVPMSEGILKTASMRQATQSQVAHASESLIDELAYAANMDPLAFRLLNMTDVKWRSPLIAATQAANWQPRVANSVKQTGDVVKGRGIGMSTHGAAPSSGNAVSVAEIEVNKKTGKIVVKQVYVAQDNEFQVGPALVENQMSGGVIIGTSRALVEQVRFDKSRVTSLDWATYPLLRFKDAPKVTAMAVQRPGVPIEDAVGAGEPSAGTMHGAIANAFFDATGVRIRQTPMTPPVVRAVLKAAGVS